VRQQGMIVAAEMARDGDRCRPFPWQERRGLRVYQHGLRHEALLRPIGNVVYFMPPYVIEPEEIDHLVATARDGIEAATCD
jgi:adenosylmethionine---8-amino-7-oxononanoate aminotransferase